MQKTSEYEIESYVQSLKSDSSGSKNSPEVMYVTHHLDRCINFHKNYEHRGSVKRFVHNRIHLALFNCGFYLSLCYVFVKLLYITSILMQLFLLNYWLRDEHYKNHSLFGWHNWKLSERFPRMTLCKFEVYQMTASQPHWVQCTLPINIYNEKIYVFLWFWLLFLLVLFIYDLFRTVFFMIFPGRFLTNILDKEKRSYEVNDFKRNLNVDGLLVLKLIAANTNRYYVSSIADNLFKLLFKNA